MPINQASARTGRRNFASSNTYHGSLIFFSFFLMPLNDNCTSVPCFKLFVDILLQAMEEVHPSKGRVDLIMSQGDQDLLFLILTTEQETPLYLVRQSIFTFHPSMSVESL